LSLYLFPCVFFPLSKKYPHFGLPSS
jgi:hypothetical protein